MITPLEFKCNFHGTGIVASGSQAIQSALSSRLGQLPAIGFADPKLYFDFEVASSSSSHRINKPSGNGRPFYTPQVGEAIYFPAEDWLYLDYGGRVKALSRPKEGYCRISCLEPEVDQLWLASHPLFTIPFLEMMKRQGKFSVHAAAFSENQKCVLLPGTSGAGKSTLTICLLRAGFDFLGDDMAFLHQGDQLQVLAFPESIDVTETTATFFPELQTLAKQPRKLGWPKHEVQPADFFDSRTEWVAQPKAIVFPQIGVEYRSKLTPIGADEAFLALAPNVLLTEARSSQAHLEILAKLVQIAPCYRLATGQDFDRIAELIRGVLA